MARFKPRQQVVCVKKNWVDINGKRGAPGPKYNEIVTVEKYDDEPYMFLIEHKHINYKGQVHTYNENCFEPLADISELEELLKAEPEKV